MSCVCVLRPVSVFCVLRMLGANTMLGAMDNMEFINRVFHKLYENANIGIFIFTAQKQKNLVTKYYPEWE